MAKERTMNLNDPKQLFLRELAAIYDAEHRIVRMLPDLAREAPDAQVAQALNAHLEETRQQIKNIEEVFELFGTQPERQSCAAVQGIKQEHDLFARTHPTAELLGVFDLGGAAKTEHYEIASYEGLIAMCDALGQPRCAQLLRQNLQQEQAMLQRVTGASERLLPQLMGTAGGQQIAMPGV
jgi:ferritin-like metal-binding protein YciE